MITGSGSASAVASMPRASSSVAGASTRRPRDVRVEVLEAVRVLRRELSAGARRHADHERDAHLPAGHVAQRRRVVEDLIEREQAEVHGHDLDDRPHAGDRRADPGADEGRLRERRVADALAGPNSSSSPLLHA